jgi:hypothetical protein
MSGARITSCERIQTLLTSHLLSKKLKIDIKVIFPVLYTVFKIGTSLTDLKKTENISEYAERDPKVRGICNKNLQNIPRTTYTEDTGLIF